MVETYKEDKYKVHQIKKYIIYEWEDLTCTMSNNNVWIPGIYENLETCKLVIKFEKKSDKAIDYFIKKNEDGSWGVNTYKYILELLNDIKNQ